MRRIYKVSIKQQMILLIRMVFVYTILLGVYFYFFDTVNVIFISVGSFFLVIDIIPTILVHCQYYFKNVKSELTLDFDSQTLMYKQGITSVQLNFSEIYSLVRIASYGKNTGWYSFENYRHYRIKSRKAPDLIITCLMINKIEKNLELALNIKAERKYRVVAFVY